LASELEFELSFVKELPAIDEAKRFILEKIGGNTPQYEW